MCVLSHCQLLKALCRKSVKWCKSGSEQIASNPLEFAKTEPWVLLRWLLNSQPGDLRRLTRPLMQEGNTLKTATRKEALTILQGGNKDLRSVITWMTK